MSPAEPAADFPSSMNTASKRAGNQSAPSSAKCFWNFCGSMCFPPESVRLLFRGHGMTYGSEHGCVLRHVGGGVAVCRCFSIPCVQGSFELYRTIGLDRRVAPLSRAPSPCYLPSWYVCASVSLQQRQPGVKAHRRNCRPCTTGTRAHRPRERVQHSRPRIFWRRGRSSSPITATETAQPLSTRDMDQCGTTALTDGSYWKHTALSVRRLAAGVTHSIYRSWLI